MILLNENQRKMFDLIPKPGLSKKCYGYASQVTLDSISKGRKKKDLRKSIKRLDDVNDPISKRIMEIFFPSDNQTCLMNESMIIEINIRFS